MNFLQKGNFAAAEALYSEHLQSEPDSVEAIGGLIRVLRAQGRGRDALELCKEALLASPNEVAVWAQRGDLELAMGMSADALVSYDRALSLQRDDPALLNNRGAALRNLSREAEALESFERAAALKTDFLEAHHNRSEILILMARYDEAIEACARAIHLNRRYAPAHLNQSICHMAKNEFAEAAECLERALKADPGVAYARGLLLHCRMKLCDWRSFDSESARIEKAIVAGDRAAIPFYILATPVGGAARLKCAQLYGLDRGAEVAPPYAPKRERKRRLRLGYFSADLHDHPVGQVLVGVLERHKKSFEVIAFSFSPKSSSPTAKRIEAACDQFIDCSTSSDREVVALARSAGIDVAVDLMGYTTNCRPELFCMRVAPVQVNYLGYAGTMGAPWMDYIIADETVIPEHLKQFYTEKVVWMPDTYFPTDASRDIAPCGATRAELGLPSDGFVFCCVNNAYKIAPIDFDLWMRILSKAAGSVLWLADAAPDVRRRLVAEAEKRGVDGARLIFKQRTPTVAEHLGQLGLADLFLDTTYYNGHTTTYDALWAGLPVLTKPGNEFSDRVAASLIRALEMPELIASSAEEYEELALEFASDPVRLSALRDRLRAKRETTALFDTDRYTNNLETAFHAMWNRHSQGQPPIDLVVDASQSSGRRSEGMLGGLKKLFGRT